jgi:hypothetical protein
MFYFHTAIPHFMLAWRAKKRKELWKENKKNPIYHAAHLNKKKTNINLSFLSEALLKLKILHFASAVLPEAVKGNLTFPSLRCYQIVLERGEIPFHYWQAATESSIHQREELFFLEWEHKMFSKIWDESFVRCIWVVKKRTWKI